MEEQTNTVPETPAEVTPEAVAEQAAHDAEAVPTIEEEMAADAAEEAPTNLE